MDKDIIISLRNVENVTKSGSNPIEIFLHNNIDVKICFTTKFSFPSN